MNTKQELDDVLFRIGKEVEKVMTQYNFETVIFNRLPDGRIEVSAGVYLNDNQLVDGNKTVQ